MRVRFTRPAQADLHRVHRYIAQDNPPAASRVIARLEHYAKSLAVHPRQGRQTDEPGTYVLALPRQLRYLIFYRIVGDEVHITHIRHTSQNRPPNWGR